MNVQGLKEYIQSNFSNLSFVEKPSVDELIIKKANMDKYFSIKTNVIRNQFMVTFPDSRYIVNNIHALHTLLAYIN